MFGLQAPLELFVGAVKWQRADPSRFGLSTGLYVRGSLHNYACFRCVGMNSKSSLAFSNRAMAYLKVSEQDGTHRTGRRNGGVAHRICVRAVIIRHAVWYCMRTFAAAFDYTVNTPPLRFIIARRSV